MKVFVTVGTTEFRGLCDVMLSADVADILSGVGFTHCVIQYGRSYPAAPKSPDSKLKYELFDFSSDLSSFIADCDLVVSHCGAGTALEVQRAGKMHMVVVNDSLMGNHQTELADALADGNFAVSAASPEEFRDQLLSGNLMQRLWGLVPRKAQGGGLQAILDEVL